MNQAAPVALAPDLRAAVRGEVSVDVDADALYSADASNHRHVPMAVVAPLDAPDVEAAMAVCRPHGVRQQLLRGTFDGLGQDGRQRAVAGRADLLLEHGGPAGYRPTIPLLPRRSRAALAFGCVVLAAAGCAAADPDTSNPIAPPRAATTSPANPATCADTTTWFCVQQQRFAAATGYAQRVVGANGYLSAVFTDRQSGQSWRLGPTQHAGWAASTIKLAIAADLLQRRRSGEITLSAADGHDLDAMLHSSDEPAADRLWWTYGGEDMLTRLRDRLGMTGLHFVPGFSARAYWGFVKCTSEDLAALGRYVLERTDAADRAYLVDALRGVAGDQQWGVWAAGAGEQPGNKDGWSFESDSYGKHWVADTVGFAGPQQRYVVAVMYQVGPSGDLADGVHAVSDLVALLFGRDLPAPVVVPAPEG